MFIVEKDRKLFEVLWVRRYCKVKGIVYNGGVHAKIVASNKVAIDAEYKSVNPKKKK
jgi:hypothetical protein